MGFTRGSWNSNQFTGICFPYKFQFFCIICLSHLSSAGVSVSVCVCASLHACVRVCEWLFRFDLCPGDGADLAAGGTARSGVHTVDNEHARSHAHFKAASISPVQLKAWSALHYHRELLSSPSILSSSSSSSLLPSHMSTPLRLFFLFFFFCS